MRLEKPSDNKSDFVSRSLDNRKLIPAKFSHTADSSVKGSTHTFYKFSTNSVRVMAA